MVLGSSDPNQRAAGTIAIVKGQSRRPDDIKKEENGGGVGGDLMQRGQGAKGKLQIFQDWV